jgi:hypothetical protein
MSTKDDDQIEIEIDDASSPVSDEIKVEVIPESTKKRAVEPDDGLEALKVALQQEKAARIAAEQRAQKAARSAYNAQNEAHDSNLSLVSNAIATVGQTNEILKANYRDAMSVGDYDRASDIQVEMASNQAKLLQLEQGKQALENQSRPQVPQPYQSDPVEALASQLSPRSANWLRAHPEFATDQRLYQKMLAAHNLAVADGHRVDTDDYFAEIEGTLRINRSESQSGNSDPTQQAAQVTQRRSAPPAAPVSRSGTAPGTRPNTVRLTAQQIEMAELMGMTPQQYAKNLLALQKEGKLH